MKSLRIAQLTEHPAAKLNDEAVLAGAVALHGFTHAPLEDVIPEQVCPETFNTNPPHLFEALQDDALETRLFHPVIPYQTILDRLETGDKAYTRRRLRKVLQKAPPGMRQELLARLHAP